MWLYKTLVILMLWTFVHSVPRYDCTLNGGYDCKHGGKCHYFGFCRCPIQFEGVDCGLQTSSITPAAKCSVECKNGGTCFNGNQCYCHEDFTGETCDTPKTVARCGVDRVIIEAYRPLGFVGEIYVHRNRKICKLVEIPSDIDGKIKFARPILHSDTSECALTRVPNTPKVGDVTFKATIYSTYNYNQFGLRDHVMELSCVHSTVILGSVNETTEDSFPYQMMSLDKNGEQIQAVAANDDIILQFEPKNIGGVKGVLLDLLEVYSIDVNASALVSKTMIKNGCVKQEAVKHLGVPIRHYTELNKEGTIWIAKVATKAFILLPKEPILFKSKLRFCKDKCPMPKCPM